MRCQVLRARFWGTRSREKSILHARLTALGLTFMNKSNYKLLHVTTFGTENKQT